MPDTTSMLTCERVERTFQGPSGVVHGLRDLDLEVRRGEFIAIHGPSGSGKSTLLLTLGGMLRPSTGRVTLDGQDLYALNAGARNRLRSTAIGFVFQLFHLVPYLTVRDNILAGLPNTADTGAKQRVEILIEELGLASRARHFPATLSAGERQRTALARAMAKQPKLILADEPTGNLDTENSAIVFSHLTRFQRQGGTVLVVTHGRDADAHANRVLHLENGRIHAGKVPSLS